MPGMWLRQQHGAEQPPARDGPAFGTRDVALRGLPALCGPRNVPGLCRGDQAGRRLGRNILGRTLRHDEAILIAAEWGVE